MRFAEWWEGLQGRLSRRSNPLQLGHRNLYILPSRYGGVWLLTAGLLYLIGINTRSNGPLLLAFLMGALILLALFLTHFNLQGLVLEASVQPIGFADENSTFRVQSRSRLERPGLVWRWLIPGAPPQQRLNLTAGANQLCIPWVAHQRGCHNPGRLLLHTTAPLGLFRCWTYWEPPERIWVAPARTSGPVLELNPADTFPQGCDDFDDLQPWREADGLQRVDWKAVARGRGWLKKQFSKPKPCELWLAPQPQLPLEQALEHLCERLCSALQQGQSVGLQLPGGTLIEPGKGSEHLDRCLKALAELPA
jgi:uncharacterized protein (DUF58 family)